MSSLALAADEPRLEEIIVTAQKREASLQDVAVSMTALSSATLEDFKITNFYDYATLVPGLSSNFSGPVSDLGVRPVGMRGIQSNTLALASGQNTVGFYINNTPVPVSNPHLTDIERIEVLRGPQGTLYGSSSLAGLIKVVTKAPRTDRVEGSAAVSVSDTRFGGTSYDVEGTANLPLSDKAAVRLGAYYEKNEGFIDFVGISTAAVPAPTGVRINNVNDETSKGGRAAALFDVSDDFSMTASLTYNKHEVDTQDQYTVGAGPGIIQNFYLLQPSSDETTLTDVTLKWNAGTMAIESTTAYYDQNGFARTDQTRQGAPLLVGRPLVPVENTLNLEEWTHETRAVSQWEGPVQMVGGLFYTDRDEVSTAFISAQGSPTVAGLPVPNNTLLSTVDERKRREFALYAHADWAVTDIITLSGGLRYFDFKFSTADNFFGSTLFVAGTSLISSGTTKEDGVVPNVSLELRPSEGHLFYATAAKGFRMGGANFPLPNLPGCGPSLTAFFGTANLPSSYESDSLWSYEIGAKNSWLEDRITTNVAGYSISWNNTQVAVTLGAGCGFGGLAANVGKVKSDGFEFETQIRPFDDLTVGGGLSYIDSKVAEDLRFPGATISLAPKGRRLPNIPKWSFSVLAQYDIALTDTLNGFIRGDYRYQGRRADNLGSPAIKDAYEIANFKTGIMYEAWELAVYVDNAFDERPQLQGNPIPVSRTKGNRPFDTTLRPRTVGVSATWRF